jgi:hypothetical protein
MFHSVMLCYLDLRDVCTEVLKLILIVSLGSVGLVGLDGLAGSVWSVGLGGRVGSVGLIDNRHVKDVTRMLQRCYKGVTRVTIVGRNSGMGIRPLSYTTCGM